MFLSVQQAMGTIEFELQYATVSAYCVKVLIAVRHYETAM